MRTDEEQEHADRNHSDLEFKTGFGSFRARGYDGMQILVVIGQFAMAFALYYLATVITAQLVALEYSQRMTLCVLALPDAKRWEQITNRNSDCSLLARYKTAGP